MRNILDTMTDLINDYNVYLDIDAVIERTFQKYNDLPRDRTVLLKIFCNEMEPYLKKWGTYREPQILWNNITLESNFSSCYLHGTVKVGDYVFWYDGFKTSFSAPNNMTVKATYISEKNIIIYDLYPSERSVIIKNDEKT